jgi:glycerophosphoryl diester phosphodiesterase
MIINRILITLSVAGILMMSVCARAQDATPSRAWQIQRELRNATSNVVLVVAHRGAHKTFPENSLSAIREAARLGADIVEIDLQRTRDGHFVLMHDPTLGRTTNGHGAVAAMTLDDVRRLRLKMPDGTLSTEGVPTLEEALTAARNRCLLDLDKVETHVDAVVDVVRRRGMSEHVIIRSWQPAVLVKPRLKKWKTPPVWVPRAAAPETARAFVKELQPPAVDVVFASPALPIISADFVKEMRTAGARVWVNAMLDGECGGRGDRVSRKDPDAGWGWLVSRGVGIIGTDEPEALVTYLRKRGVHD